MSIRHTLLFSIISGMFACTVVIAFFSYFNSAHEMNELFKDNMKRTALVIEGQVFPTISFQTDATRVVFDEPEESSVIQVWDDKGALLRSSPQTTSLPLHSKEGFSATTINGQKWSIYTLKADNNGFIQIAQPRHVVTTMVYESAASTLVPFAILFCILGVAALLIVDRSLLPLSHLSHFIASQNIDELKPLPASKTQTELQPIVKALNELLGKLDQAIALQRQFTADAAHELRTPLTAVKLQAEVLNRAQSSEEREEAMKKLSEGIDRSITMATQLLTASRSMSVKTASDFGTVRLHEIVRQRIAAFAPLASAKNIEVVLGSCDEFTIRGDEEGIRAMTDNLIDNAIRYTPPGGKIYVSFSQQDRKAVLQVTDTGHGIPKDQKDKIFQRFYRIPGSPVAGAGLGLSIVKDVAENHGAVVVVNDDDDGRGAVFRVIFGQSIGAAA